MKIGKLKKKLRHKKSSGVYERRKERMIYLENKLAGLKQRTWTPRLFFLAQVTNYELTRLEDTVKIYSDREEKEKEYEEHTGDSG